MQISVQMYSIRHALEADYLGAVGRLVELGLTVAEPFDLVAQREDLVAAREAHDIAFPSAHQSFLGDQDLDEVLDAARAVGARYVVDPYWNPEDWQHPDRVRDLAARLNEKAARAADAGIRLGYHNHGFELAARHDGATALELLASHLSDDVVLEIDTYWAAVGGADAAALIRDLGDRVRMVHLKDGDLSEDPDRQLPLGTGAMPLEETLAASLAGSVELGVIEFDGYAGDIFEGIAASLARLRDLG
ncbi:sugar phosphate isomerase/epimerase family protein [Brachybacterium sp. DNPG3]